MSFCPQCGVENPSSARFCDQCGAALPVRSVSPPQSTAPTAAAAPPANSTGAAGLRSCSQCGTIVIPGEAFCDSCGAPLLGPTTSAPSKPAAPNLPYGGVPPQPNYPAPQPSTFKPSAPPPVQSFQPAPVAPSSAPGRSILAPAQLFMPEEGRAIKLPEASQVIIGRIDSMSSFTPDIDLTPYGAFENGVGRRHLQLSVQGGQIIAEDLGSKNGSFINGKKLSPHSPYQLRNGDELCLGTLVMRLQL